MNTNDIIRRIRKIAKTEKIEHSEIESIISSYACTNPGNNSVSISFYSLSEFVSKATVNERFRQAGPFFDAFKNKQYAVIKGAVLSNRLYASPYLRRSGDLDVLIFRHDLDYAKHILLKNGFVQGRIVNNRLIPFSRNELIFQLLQSHQSAPFVKATNNRICPYVNLDLNISVFWGEYESKTDMDIVLKETRESVVLGTPIKTLMPEMEFITLCLHHYKDFNSLYLLSLGNWNLNHFFDLFLYLKNVPLEIKRLKTLAYKLNAIPYMYYCLWYTDQIFDSEITKSFLDLFKTEEGVALIEYYGLASKERKKWEICWQDRLFSPTFQQDFYSSLNKEEKNKVDINRLFM